jgi:electron transfer flavoprotein alpha subunit
VDYGIVGDLETVLPALLDELDASLDTGGRG